MEEYMKDRMTYARDVDHCKPSPYIKEVTIKSVKPASNSDKLDAIEFEEIGWRAVSQKGLHIVGEKVLFIPAESVIPIELGEKLGVTNYLSHGRVRVARLRGNRSEGLIVNPHMVEPYIPYIMKWEDLPGIHMLGECIKAYEINPRFHKFVDMPDIMNEPNTFEIGEKIYYSEKIHGSNARCGHFRNPTTEEYMYYVGGHRMVFKESEKVVYWRMFNKHLRDKIPSDIEFFYEVFGPGIQDLKYGLKEVDIRIFAASSKGYYMSPNTLDIMCKQHSLPVVTFRLTKFKSVDQLREFANQPSELTDKHMREGIVAVSADRPERMAKCKSDKYEERRNKKERH